MTNPEATFMQSIYLVVKRKAIKNFNSGAAIKLRIKKRQSLGCIVSNNLDKKRVRLSDAALFPFF